jgi:PilZ domain
MNRAGPSSSDRRAFGRRPTFQHASAVISGRPPLRCIVRDISEGGALLDFGEPVSLPYRLRLVWDGSGAFAECDVRHVQGANAGVQFTCQDGPRIARESVALHAGGPLPPAAPALDRPAMEKLSIALVQNFRLARQAAGQPPFAAAAIASVATDTRAAVPLPLAARQYAAAL